MTNLLPHLPALLVTVPLFSAPVCVLLRNSFVCWIISVAVSGLALVASGWMLMQTLQGQIFTYTFGGWQAPWGIAYQVTTLNAFMAVLVSLIALVVTLYAKRSIENEFPNGRIDLFFASFMLCLCGLLGVTISNDLFNIFIFLEIASLSSYVLVSFIPGGRAPLAAFRYLIIGSLGATFLLIGIGYLYALTGTLNLADIAARLPTTEGGHAILAALAFISFGLLIKMALFPLHVWQPDVYTYAPSSVSAWLSATTSKISIYLFMRLFLEIFIPVKDTIPFETILSLLAGGAIIFGAVSAVGQNDLKRLFAYSSVSQIGYILLGVSLFSMDGTRSALIYLFNHSLIKAGLFLALGGIVYHLGAAHLQQLTGLGRRMPWTASAIAVGGLSLIGVPLTAGFISKWYLIEALLKASQGLLVVIVLLGSVIAIAYVWRILERLYETSPNEEYTVREAPFALLFPAWILIGLNIYLGINPDALIFAATAAADSLMAGQ